MKVSDAMTRGASIARPNETLQQIARRMAAEDIGFMPVGDDDRLLGTVTATSRSGPSRKGEITRRPCARS